MGAKNAERNWIVNALIANSGVSIAKDYLTPGFNPNLGHPLARKSGELWKYVIRNFQASGVGNLPLGVVGVIANFLAALQSAADDELIHCDPKVKSQISKMLNVNNLTRISKGSMTSGTDSDSNFS